MSKVRYYDWIKECKENKNKVYCEDCHHVRCSPEYYCKRDIGVQDTPRKREFIYAAPDEHNKDNHCKFYLSEEGFKVEGIK